MMECYTPRFFLSRKVALPAITLCRKREKLLVIINV
jgi:hypothetical protein